MLQQYSHKMQASAEPKTDEHRRQARYQFTAAVEAVDASSQTRIQGRTSDLSRGGCYVDTISTFPAGSIVKMRFTKEMRTLEVDAEVIYSLTGMGMGVKFTGTAPEQLWTLENWVGELSGELPAQRGLPQAVEESCAPVNPADNDSQVLAEVITELMRLGVLPSAKCEAMLRKLDRTASAKISSAHG